MKKTITTAISAFAAVLSLNAGFDVTTAYTTDYYFRGTQFADSMIEAAVDYSAGDFYVGIWSANPLDAPDANEVDYYAGYGIALSDVISLDVGATVYSFPDAGAESTYEGFIGAAFDTTMAPSAYIYYDTELEVLTLEGSIGHSIEFETGAALDFGLTGGFVSPDEGDSGMYYLLSAGYSYSGVSVSLNYTDGDSELTGGNWDDGFYASIGFSASF